MSDTEILNWLESHPRRMLSDLDNYDKSGWRWYDRRGAREGGAHKGWTKAKNLRDAVRQLAGAMQSPEWEDWGR